MTSKWRARSQPESRKSWPTRSSCRVRFRGPKGRPLTASIGVAVYPHHLPRQGTTDLKKNLLLRAADLAMYRGKENGKNQIRIAD